MNDEIVIDEDRTPGYRKNMYTYYIVTHNCYNGVIHKKNEMDREFKDDWKFCPYCGKKIKYK